MDTLQLPIWAGQRAPDYVEPIEAWRIWLIDKSERGPALRSVFFTQFWVPGGPTVAVCGCGRRSRLAPWRRVQAHAAPDPACDCGIYGAASPVEIQSYVDRDTPSTLCWAIGRVALWGTVVECPHGWRGSHAYPRRIAVPTVQGATRRTRRPGYYESVAAALGRYGVPVELVDGDAHASVAAIAV